MEVKPYVDEGMAGYIYTGSARGSDGACLKKIGGSRHGAAVNGVPTFILLGRPYTR